MKYSVDGKEYTYTDNIKEDSKALKSFFELSKDTFGLDFEPWYKAGFWGENYIPHALLDEGTVVSNVSVNIIDFICNGEKIRSVQLGTIMTAKEHRGKGLSRFLLERVLEEWKVGCDVIYLFANDSVLDFYPKFGFKPAEEYEYIYSGGQLNEYSHEPERAASGIRKLDMSLEEDKKLFMDICSIGNPFSRLTMVDNPGLIMFYCAEFMKENVYYLEEFGAAAVAEFSEDGGFLHDVFSKGDHSLSDVINALRRSTETAALDFTLGFTPNDEAGFKVRLIQEEDSTLFLLEGSKNILDGSKMMFPTLSHA